MDGGNLYYVLGLSMMIIIPVFFICCRVRLMHCCLGLSKVPNNVVPLSQDLHDTVRNALQGSWSIKAITMNNAMNTNNAIVKPINFTDAEVNGMSYLMTGARGHPQTQQFKFSKDPESGQIYLDQWGSTCVTAGWPQSRPMAGQEGEIMDFQTSFACIRWTRKETVGATLGFGQPQTASKDEKLQTALPVYDRFQSQV